MRILWQRGNRHHNHGWLEVSVNQKRHSKACTQTCISSYMRYTFLEICNASRDKEVVKSWSDRQGKKRRQNWRIGRNLQKNQKKFLRKETEKDSNKANRSPRWRFCCIRKDQSIMDKRSMLLLSGIRPVAKNSLLAIYKWYLYLSLISLSWITSS